MVPSGATVPILSPSIFMTSSGSTTFGSAPRMLTRSGLGGTITILIPPSQARSRYPHAVPLQHNLLEAAVHELLDLPDELYAQGVAVDGDLLVLPAVRGVDHH